MSGVLLPGTAGPAEVLTGYTASGAGGVGFAGAGLGPTKGSLVGSYTTIPTTASVTLTLPFTPPVGSSVVLAICGATSMGTITPSGLGATWSVGRDVETQSPIFFATGVDGTSNTVTVDVTGSVASNQITVMAIMGTLAINVTTGRTVSGTSMAVAFTSAAGNCVVINGSTNIAGTAAISNSIFGNNAVSSIAFDSATAQLYLAGVVAVDLNVAAASQTYTLNSAITTTAAALGMSAVAFTVS